MITSIPSIIAQCKGNGAYRSIENGPAHGSSLMTACANDVFYINRDQTTIRRFVHPIVDRLHKLLHRGGHGDVGGKPLAESEKDFHHCEMRQDHKRSQLRKGFIFQSNRP